MRRKLTSTLAAVSMIGTAAFAEEQIGISATITDIAAGADRHDWTRVRGAFGDTVTIDYTSLWGGKPATQPADDLVAGWASFLPGFDSTHHMVTNHTITALSDRTAAAQADFTATHRIDDGLWVLGGRYDYALEKSDDRWVVTSMTMTALWESGDRDLVAVSGERAAEAN